MTANMYRVGDYVYFETSSTSPYQIRRIEELNKTPSGNVEAKVMCFYRRRDLPSSLIQLADKHQMANSDESPVAMKLKKMWLKTPSGVEADEPPAVMDHSLLGALEESSASGVGSPGSGNTTTAPVESKQRHQMKHRELFLSRQVETIPATHIRGKCSVTLLNETESLSSYLNKEDTFFYCLVFDPTQKTLLADRGEIRVGSRYQSDIISLLKEGEPDPRNTEPPLETLVWTPYHGLTDRQIDQFLVVSRSVGTFARALDCSSSVKQPSLHMSAAAASRDITLFHAMDTLHQHNYSLSSALASLVPSTGPVLCRDEMEEWSASEANLFEEALDKYGKDFNDIRQDFLPWKTLNNIIEYYYMWKTTDRYVQQKRVKAVEAESKLKQVYIPNYNKSNPVALNNGKSGIVNGSSNGNGDPIVSAIGKPCESCNAIVSQQWYAWGPTHMQCRLCQSCWQYWKRYGGLKAPSKIGENDIEMAAKKKLNSGEIEDERLLPASAMSQHRPHRHYQTAHGIVVRSGSPRPIMKTRSAFYLYTTPLTRISRRLCRHLMRPRHAARAPFFAINIAAVKQECALAMTGKSLLELRALLIYRRKERGSVTDIATRLGNPGSVVPEWLILTDRDNMPKPVHVAFPKPPKAPDGSLLYERVPNKPEAEKIPLNSMSPSLKRRSYEDINGVDGAIAPPAAKRPNKDPMPLHRPSPEQYAAMVAAAASTGQPLPRHIAHVSTLNGKLKIAHMARTGSGRKQVITSPDAPDDVYFRATEASRKARRAVTSVELRRAARKPWKPMSGVVATLPIIPPTVTPPTLPLIPIIPTRAITTEEPQVVILD
ncbi:metastasis-associated protein MTA3 isoform X2 [Chrysoperla carnea]|uniref:metastasis-associated protein MTA3 isoform X2 n=1 Tax=Chrysoperla carnea TaxID=189513 RepID=UPI001D09773D|nr:metastasis-associated protein MTA3 isoform X2 [Chrysoperla carnea]